MADFLPLQKGLLQKGCKKRPCSFLAKSQEWRRKEECVCLVPCHLSFLKSQVSPLGELALGSLHHPALQEARFLPCSVVFPQCLEMKGSSAPIDSTTTHRWEQATQLCKSSSSAWSGMQAAPSERKAAEGWQGAQSSCG